MCVKNPESIEPLRVLQANYLSCHSSTNAGRRWETLGSEAKDSITHSNSSSWVPTFSCVFPKPQFPQGDVKRARWHVHWQQVAFHEKNPACIWESKHFIMGSKLMCLLRSLHTGQEATVRAGHETTDWFGIGKGIHQGCMLSPCFFNLYAEYIMRNTGLDKAQDWREKRQSPQICRWQHPYGRKRRRTEEPLDETERGELRSWLKTQHSKN